MAKKITVIPATAVSESNQTQKSKIRVAAYCRVSTDHEDQEGSCRNQVDYYTNLNNNNPD